MNLITSLEPTYAIFYRLCLVTGSWSGDIYALRKHFFPTPIDGQSITRQLTALQRRELLTFTAQKLSHKRIIWTVTLTQPRGSEAHS